ncbi:hypothetical protein AOLI_G00038610 [Acnodon oligacanthus]
MEWCGVQQGDGGRKEARPGLTTSDLNGFISPPRWEEVQQCVAGVGADPDYAQRWWSVSLMAGSHVAVMHSVVLTTIWKAFLSASAGLPEFQPYGDVMTLGKYGDPCLTLVNIDGWMDTAPPLQIKDQYERTFELQCLLLWKRREETKHMVVCCNLESRWVLYDENPRVAPHVDFRFDAADFKNDYSISWAVYVNITQPGRSNVGVPVAEEGLRPGASVWNWSRVGNGNQRM